MADATEQQTADKAPDAEQAAKGAARLLELTKDAGAAPFHDDMGDAFLAVPLSEGGTKTVRVRSRDCRSWLAHLSYTSDGKPASGAALDGAVSTLEGAALHDPEAPCLPLSVRVADREDAIWIDLGGADWKAVKVTRDGWTIEPAPVTFRRYSHMRTQAIPEHGGDARKVFDFLHLADDAQKALLLPWLVAAMVPDIPHAAIVLHGPAGTGKTTTMRVLRRLIDPSAAEVLTLPHDPAQLVQALAHHYVTAFDNLDGLGADASDALCRAVTGDGATKRTLYSDDDDTVYSYRRVLLLSGVNIVAQRPDLLDRSLLLGLRPIPRGERRDEATFWTEFEEARPYIFGGMLDALSTAMRLRPAVRLKEKPRLADFALWGYAAGEVLGVTCARGIETLTGGVAFVAAYAANIINQNDEALSAHPVGQALIALLQEQGAWSGKPSDLLKELTSVADREKIDTHSRAWPKAANALKRRVREVEHNLTAEGWTCYLDDRATDRTRERRWSFEKAEAREKPSESPAPSDVTRNLLGDNDSASDDTSDDPVVSSNTVRGSSNNNPLRRKASDDSGDSDDTSLPSDSRTWGKEVVGV